MEELYTYGDQSFEHQKLNDQQHYLLFERMAEDISFKLLATKKHADFKWLVEYLKKEMSR